MKSIALTLAISASTLLVTLSLLLSPPAPLLSYWLSNTSTQQINYTAVHTGGLATGNSCYLQRPVAVMLDTQSPQPGLFYLGEANSSNASDILKAADCTQQTVQTPTSQLLTYDGVRSMQGGKFILVFHPQLDDVLVFEMAAQPQIMQNKSTNSRGIIEM